MSVSRIPIFPLRLVLFPGALLPLHIFEPRYKLMVHDCRVQSLAFGVSLAGGAGIASVGCTASLLDIVRKYPDGRMDILTRGQSRFRLRSLHQDKPYVEADAEDFPDEDFSSPPEPDLHLFDMFDRCHRLIFSKPAEKRPAETEASLAYLYASELPLDLPIKQALLELPGESARRQFLLNFLYEMLPRLEELSRNGERPRKGSVRLN